MTAACPSTDANTWLGAAPTARSIANSRCRWRTTMANVLLMMKVPTKSAMPAKTSRKVEMKPSADIHSSAAAARIWSPVSTSTDPSATVPARASSTASASADWLTPSSA